MRDTEDVYVWDGEGGMKMVGRNYSWNYAAHVIIIWYIICIRINMI